MDCYESDDTLLVGWCPPSVRAGKVSIDCGPDGGDLVGLVGRWAGEGSGDLEAEGINPSP
jgi:hypothetical protein